MLFRSLYPFAVLRVTRRHLKTYTALNRASIEPLLQSWSSVIPVERAPTLPSGFYTSRDVFELEKRAIFGQNWLWAGRASQLNRPGDFISDRFLSEPYLINVDTTSTLRAHYNVCCHHGMLLMKDGQGHVEHNEIVCPYHGWTYDLSGRLKKALRLKNIQDFQASKIRLKPISLRKVGPFVYLNFNFLDRDAVIDNDSSHIEHIDQKYLTPTNYEQLEFVARRSYPIKCNWKVFIDNYLDGGYHVPYAHKQLAATLNMKGYKTVIDHPKTSVQYCTGTERTEGTVVFAFVYPNLMINRYGSLMDTNLVVPVDESNCIVHMDYYFCPKSTTKQAEEESRNESHRVQEEDIHLCENVQRGLESQAYDSGRYVPSVEHAMFDFHKTYYEQLELYHKDQVHDSRSSP